jgi:hypothetical protein
VTAARSGGAMILERALNSSRHPHRQLTNLPHDTDGARQPLNTRDCLGLQYSLAIATLRQRPRLRIPDFLSQV